MADKIRNLFREQGTTILSILTALSMTISTIVLAIVGSVVGAILSFLSKAVGFFAEHTWALIVFFAGLIGVWFMQKVKKG